LKRESNLQKEIEEKTKCINEQRETIDKKLDIDATSYNKYLQERLHESLEEAKRHFENYILVR
jgi:hypothetical protein